MFIDLDHELEKEMGMAIGQYFDLHGEIAFRQLESRVLKSFSYPDNCVVATGGGVPCYFDNMDWMNANGTTVYIEMTPAALARRLENGRAQRPLLKALSEKELIDFIEQKLGERHVFYRRALIIIEGISLTADALIAALNLND